MSNDSKSSTLPPSVGEFAIEDRQRLLERVAEQAREIERLWSDRRRDADMITNMRAELAALKAQPSGVVSKSELIDALEEVWERSYDFPAAFALAAKGLADELNSSPVSAGATVKQSLTVGGVEDRAAFNNYLNEVVETKQYGTLTIKLQRHDEYTVRDEQIAMDAWMARAALSAPSHTEDVLGMVPSHGEQVRGRYTCIGKGGNYQLLGLAQGAGTLKGFNHMVYRNVDGVMFVREPEDFLSRMEKIAAAPSAGSQKEQGE